MSRKQTLSGELSPSADDEGAGLKLLLELAASVVHSDTERALSLAAEGLALGEKLGAPESLIEARRILGVGSTMRAEYDAALEHFSEGLRLCQEEGLQSSVALLLTNTGTVHFYRGDHSTA